MTTDDPRHPIYRRRRTLVIGIVAYLAEQPAPVPWDHLLETFATPHLSWKTLENVIRELENFGALHRIGQAATRRAPDTRALLATPLGRAWLDGDTIPLPGHDRTEPDNDDLDLDPIELADHIADEYADLLDDLDLGNPLDPEGPST